MAWFGWYWDGPVTAPAPKVGRPKVGRPNRGNRAQVKAGRKAAKHR